jgi:tetratricopeptide (TPR) repeat protein
MRHAPWRAIAILALLAILAACTARVPPRGTAVIAPSAPAIDLPGLSALIDRGCFACLERAFAAAEQQGAPQQAFEAAALLALRAKELGLPPDRWLEQARAIVGLDTRWPLLLEMVDAVPPDPLSGSRDALLSQTPERLRRRRLLPSWLDILKTGPASPAFRAYLELALTCRDNSQPGRGEFVASLSQPVRETPLMQYRLGICGFEYAAQLRALRSRDAEFVDADYALAMYALGNRDSPHHDEALRLLGSAATAFPGSPAILTTIGEVHQTLEQWEQAKGAYDAALALVPEHPDAMLGRTISLSHLGQHDAAIASATRLIDGGRWYLGQAFYWRAWNQFNLASYAAARADADRTRVLLVNASVFVLSGMIEWRLRHLETAEREFDEALAMDAGHCEAAAFLGGVRRERKRPEALAAFTQARRCYDLTLAMRQKAIAQVGAGPGSPASKAREIARHERAIAEAERRRAEAVRAVEELAR